MGSDHRLLRAAGNYWPGGIQVFTVADKTEPLTTRFDQKVTPDYVHGEEMLEWSRLGIFVTVVLIIVITPGPNTLYIIASSLYGGYRAGLASCAGVLLATLTHIAAAAVGLTALVASSQVIFKMLKYTGAVYLIYIGLKTMFRKPRLAIVSETRVSAFKASVTQGFLVNLLNPKTALFFLAFLPQFVKPSLGNVPGQIILFGVILAFIGTTSDCAYATAAARTGRWLGKNLDRLRSLRYICGSVYLGLALFTVLNL